eukprot:1487355-Prymnesium_polylepis.1
MILVTAALLAVAAVSLCIYCLRRPRQALASGRVRRAGNILLASTLLQPAERPWTALATGLDSADQVSPRPGGARARPPPPRKPRRRMLISGVRCSGTRRARPHPSCRTRWRPRRRPRALPRFGCRSASRLAARPPAARCRRSSPNLARPSGSRCPRATSRSVSAPRTPSASLRPAPRYAQRLATPRAPSMAFARSLRAPPLFRHVVTVPSPPLAPSLHALSALSLSAPVGRPARSSRAPSPAPSHACFHPRPATPHAPAGMRDSAAELVLDR